MPSSTHTQLQKIKKKYYELQRVREHLAGLEEKVAEQDKLLQKLEKKMKKEFADYEKIEGKSLKGFFYSVLGSKEEQIEKERQEYIQASLQYEQHRKLIDLTEYEIGVLGKKVERIESVENHYKQLYAKREKELLAEHSTVGRQMVSLVEERQENERIMHLIQKTEKQGVRALKNLQQMTRLLQQARNWGNWDMYSRNSRGYQKHSAIDRAKQLSYRTKHELDNYSHALTTIYGERKSLQIKLALDGVSQFTDIYFDNLITDWIIQQKITNSLNTVKAMYDRVSRIQQNLANNYEQYKMDNRSIDAERRRLVEGD